MNKYNIAQKNWKEDVVKEILDAPTIRQSIEEIGYGLSRIIDSLIIEWEVPEEYSCWHKFIKYHLQPSKIDRDNSEGAIVMVDTPAQVRKSRRLWKAVDEVMYLYSCQLEMTDEQVEEAVYNPKIMNALGGTKHRCHHGAFIHILDEVHDLLVETREVIDWEANFDRMAKLEK